MVFSSEVFLFLFLPVVLLVYYVFLRFSRTAKNIFLFLVSIGFYAWGEPIYVSLMLASILVNWMFGRMLFQRRLPDKLIVTLALIYNLSFLFVFKYFGFFVQNFNVLFSQKVSVPTIALPIGISFYTFQALSYVIDVYREKERKKDSILQVGLYISFFPQLIAGPIVRYQDIAEEIRSRKENFNCISDGCWRFMIGLAKKVLIANQVAQIADAIFGIADKSVATAWLGAIAYTLQIYFDFSGYSDMAIGLGQMFGFHFKENFNYPYVSKSVTEFWRRWHISLSGWFRDYVYIPLGGNRVSKSRHILNLTVVWLLTGFWHGANWTFILWGLLYLCMLLIEKYTKIIGKIGSFSHIYTMVIVILAWVLFRAESITSAVDYIGTMFGLKATAILDNSFLFYISNYWFYLLCGIIFSVPVSKRISQMNWFNSKVGEIVSSIALTLLFAVTVTYIVSSSYDPFIYFNF